ncbi:hypothetical protein PRJ_0911 [Pseudomonas sp. XWY-1]|nr:hypothetical protein PRJ_0911 [Pseudomonas sp. XWY-1]
MVICRDKAIACWVCFVCAGVFAGKPAPTKTAPHPNPVSYL